MKRVLWGILKWSGIVLLVLVVAIIMLYAEEDWRGARDWAQCQKEMAAKGEILDLRTLCPPGDPKDDLSKAPIFAEEYLSVSKADAQQGWSHYKFTRLDELNVGLGSNSYAERPKMTDAFRGHPVDLRKWQTYYLSIERSKLFGKKGVPAQDVLGALSILDSSIEEILQAAENPMAYWPIDYENPYETRLSGQTKMMKLCQVLELRGAAHLENQQSELAEEDYLDSFKLNRTLERNCGVVSALVFIANRAIADGILWEGLHRHAWSEGQLQKTESALEDEPTLALVRKAFQVERADGLRTFQVVKESKDDLRMKWMSLYGEGTWFLVHLRPEGWWDKDRVAYVRRKQDLIEAINISSGTVAQIRPSRPRDDFHQILSMIVTPLSAIMNASEDEILPRIAEAETHRRLTIAACALEEYYLAHKEYPNPLAELTDLPANLNEEVLARRPLHYGRKGNSYFLYSTGWDGIDHGGIPRSPRTDDHYDWIWPGP